MNLAILIGVGIATIVGGLLYRRSVRRQRLEYDGPEDETVPHLQRTYRLYLGEQGCGKTYQLIEECRYFAERGCLVFVADTQREFGAEGKRFSSFDDYQKHANGVGIPPVSVFQLGQDPAAYNDVWAEAIREATANEDTTVCVVVDEWYVHARAGGTWTGDTKLKEILLAGRHVNNANGDIGCVHVVGAAQYPYSSHLIIWQQASSILVGSASGDRFYKWLGANYGSELVDQARALKPREWLCVKGDPRPGSGALRPSQAEN